MYGGGVWILSLPLQCVIIIIIIAITVIFNITIIINISCSELKRRSVNFVLIKHLCLVDLLGAVLILPVPLVTTIRGEFDFGFTACWFNSFVNMSVWVQHLLMFTLLKVDKVLASALPIGKYPLLPVSKVHVIVSLSWIFSISVSVVVTKLYPIQYEKAVVLCIPNLPKGFFISMLSVFCVGVVVLVVGFIASFIYIKKKQAQIQCSSSLSRVDYKALEKAALSNFLITISHIVLYVPTMLVIGLHGWILPPIGILICDYIVYSEFLIHPTLLLLTSSKLRKEIVSGVKIVIQTCFTFLCTELSSMLPCYTVSKSQVIRGSVESPVKQIHSEALNETSSKAGNCVHTDPSVHADQCVHTDPSVHVQCESEMQDLCEENCITCTECMKLKSPTLPGRVEYHQSVSPGSIHKAIVASPGKLLRDERYSQLEQSLYVPEDEGRRPSIEDWRLEMEDQSSSRGGMKLSTTNSRPEITALEAQAEKSSPATQAKKGSPPTKAEKGSPPTQAEGSPVSCKSTQTTMTGTGSSTVLQPFDYPILPTVNELAEATGPKENSSRPPGESFPQLQTSAGCPADSAYGRPVQDRCQLFSGPRGSSYRLNSVSPSSQFLLPTSSTESLCNEDGLDEEIEDMVSFAVRQSIRSQSLDVELYEPMDSGSSRHRHTEEGRKGHTEGRDGHTEVGSRRRGRPPSLRDCSRRSRGSVDLPPLKLPRTGFVRAEYSSLQYSPNSSPPGEEEGLFFKPSISPPPLTSIHTSPSPAPPLRCKDSILTSPSPPPPWSASPTLPAREPSFYTSPSTPLAAHRSLVRGYTVQSLQNNWSQEDGVVSSPPSPPHIVSSPCSPLPLLSSPHSHRPLVSSPPCPRPLVSSPSRSRPSVALPPSHRPPQASPSLDEDILEGGETVCAAPSPRIHTEEPVEPMLFIKTWQPTQ